jgi:hypothetical protein
MASKPVMTRQAHSPIGVMQLFEDGVIVHTLDVGAHIDERAANEVEALTAELADGRRVGVVVDMRQVAFADRDARDIFAREDAGGVEVATALVVGPALPEFLANRWVADSKPDRSTALFDTVDEAAEWVRAQLAGDRTGQNGSGGEQA